MSRVARTLTVIQLEDNPAEREKIERLFQDALRPALLDFLSTAFCEGSTDSLDCKLISTDSVDEFVDKVQFKAGAPSSESENCVFFLLDYYLPGPDGQICSLAVHRVGEVPFLSWLNALFPAIPKVLLTSAATQHVADDTGCRYLPKDDLNNAGTLKRKFTQIFEEWWSPNFWSALKKYADNSGSTSWHTPGHNAGNAFLRSPFQESFYKAYGSTTFETDLSVSVEHLGDLSEPGHSSPLRQAQRLSAEIFGAEDTYYVTNGTSTSNKAMLMTLLQPGDVVLLDRNCHKSVHQAVVMSGALPIYLTPAFNRALGVWAPLSMATLDTYINAAYPVSIKPRMLILTTCTYEGVLYPIREIARMCEFQGVLFYADEAWAPYMRFHPAYARITESSASRYNAIDGGAHFAVQSTHKALASFSQSSMIHVARSFAQLFGDSRPEWAWLTDRFKHAGKGSYERFGHQLQEVLRYWHSTSPHYPMLATLDLAGIQMRLEGMHLLSERLWWAEEFRKDVNGWAPDSIIGLREIVGPDLTPFENYWQDPLKLVIGFRNENTGVVFKKLLKKRHIQWEKAARGCIEFLVTIGTYDGHLQELKDAIKESRNKHLLGNPGVPDGKALLDFEMAKGQVVMLPRDAGQTESHLVELEKSTGSVCAQMLVPYPPGIPVFLPGMEITQAMVDAVASVAQRDAQNVHGLFEQDSKTYVRVVQRSTKMRTPLRLKTQISEIRRIVEALQNG